MVLLLIYNFQSGPGEMDQWLKALGALPEKPRFNSQCPDGGSQPSITQSHRT